MTPGTRARPAAPCLPGCSAVPQVAVFTIVAPPCWSLRPMSSTRWRLRFLPLALVLALGYSYTKRFTAFSHFFLGLALAVAPVGAWIAVTGRIDPPALWLGGGGGLLAVRL